MFYKVLLYDFYLIEYKMYKACFEATLPSFTSRSGENTYPIICFKDVNDNVLMPVQDALIINQKMS